MIYDIRSKYFQQYLSNNNNSTFEKTHNNAQNNSINTAPSLKVQATSA